MPEEIKKLEEHLSSSSQFVTPNEAKAIAVPPRVGGRMKLTDTTDAPVLGIGTTLVITALTISGGSSSSAGTNTTVVKVQSIKLPNITGKDVEVTGMNDTADSYIPGVVNYGEAELDIIYLKTQSATLQGLLNQTATFVITYPDTRVKQFEGWINSFGEEVTVKDTIKNKIKIRANSNVINS